MKKRALISVFYKDNILELASYLNSAGWEIISTGGTSKYLMENKIPVTEISAVTGFPECLDGRVKTLHPAIHAGILARRDVSSHMDFLQKQNLGTIDLVCNNLYPFFEKVQAGLSQEETIEFIDIGGPSMLRSAAKNFRDVIVLVDPADYAQTINGLKSGNVPFEFRKHLAGKVFDLTSAYDAAIARYLLELEKPASAEKPAGTAADTPAALATGTAAQAAAAEFEFPPFWPLSLKKAQDMRYGENSHQSAALYFHADKPGALAGMEQLHGKELGYNNIRDLDLAWKAACAFGLQADGTGPAGEEDVKRLVPAGLTKGKVCCVAVKHNTPCGIALGNTLPEAYAKTFACDPVSIFGGIVAANTVMDAVTAAKLGELQLDIIAAPGFDDAALEILKKKKNVRIMKAICAPKDLREYSAVDGGLLVQETDKRLLDKWNVVTQTAVEPADIPDLIFGMRAVTFVKSNAILVVKDLGASGIGGGQVNRIWPAIDALRRSGEVIKAAAAGNGPWQDGKPARVLASDAMLPFPDVVEAAAAAGIKAIIQPGGSINDKASIEACDKYGIAMVLTGLRHFKH
ncbi:MAG: bifunctional phosphoribosylaminoimidazolecarboxamide formyltransferase/IMP cyclohydrolase [Treponema sp.]|nr:bifunctional phosphoribosylaminoimidazolecarboxamide formyltransferase/IMP cyclohydrolase [Treponema sp.]